MKIADKTTNNDKISNKISKDEQTKHKNYIGFIKEMKSYFYELDQAMTSIAIESKNVIGIIKKQINYLISSPTLNNLMEKKQSDGFNKTTAIPKEIFNSLRNIDSILAQYKEVSEENMIKDGSRVPKSILWCKLRHNSYLTVLMQELCEFLLVKSVINSNKILTLDEINEILTSNSLNLRLTYEEYISGLSDMTGEIFRYAMNSIIILSNRIRKDGFNDNAYPTKVKVADKIIEINKILVEFFVELSDITLRSDLRRKFDAIKYNLEKMTKLIYDIKMKS